MLLGPNHTHPEKAGFVDVCTPFPRQDGPPEKKCHVESGLTAPAEMWVFGNNFRSALFTWGKRRGCLQINHTKPPPRLGLVVRCADLTLQRKTCRFIQARIRRFNTTADGAVIRDRPLAYGPCAAHDATCSVVVWLASSSRLPLNRTGRASLVG